MGEENTNLTVFNSGMRVVTRHIPNYLRTRVRFSIDAGSRDEIFGNHKRGVSHSVEHNVFKGSPDNPNPSQVSRLIESSRGVLTAATDFDAIVFDVSIPKDNLPIAVKAVGDMISHPLFPAVPVQREIRRIENEWLKGQMNPDKMRYLNAIRVSSGGTAVLNPILGDRKSISSITRQDLVDFHKEKFTAGNVVVAVEGDLSGYNINDLIQDAIDLPPGKRPNTPVPLYLGGDDRFSEPQLGTRVTLAFATPPIADSRDSAVYNVLAELLGGISSDSFYNKIIEGEELTYSINVMRRPIADYGLLTIDYDCFAENVEPSINGIAAQLKKLARYVDPDALTNLRNLENDDCKLKMKEETIGARELANNVTMYGRVLSRDHFYKLQQTVSAAEISEAARSLLQRPPTFVASGVLEGLPSSERVREMFQELKPVLPHAQSSVLTPGMQVQGMNTGVGSATLAYI